MSNATSEILKSYPFSGGCGDSLCMVKTGEGSRYGGQHTNGGCRCFGEYSNMKKLRAAAQMIDLLLEELYDL